jgi:hypothetical protein
VCAFGLKQEFSTKKELSSEHIYPSFIHTFSQSVCLNFKLPDWVATSSEMDNHIAQRARVEVCVKVRARFKCNPITK